MLLALLLSAAAAQPKVVAVLDMDIHRIQQVAPDEAKQIPVIVFSDEIRTVVRSLWPDVSVMTRENEIVMAQANGTDLAACDGAQCEVQTGKMLGANYVITSRLDKLGKELVLAVLIHETQHSSMLNSIIARGATLEELEKDMLSKLPGLLDFASAPAQQQRGPSSIVTVASDPTGATISVDGRKQGTAPLTIVDLRPGAHRLTAEADGYQQLSQNIDVAEGKTLPVTMRLQHLRGKVSITSTADVDCTVAGQPVRVRANSIEVVDADVGDAAVRCDGSFLQPEEKRVTVRQDGLAQVRFNLRQIEVSHAAATPRTPREYALGDVGVYGVGAIGEEQKDGDVESHTTAPGYGVGAFAGMRTSESFCLAGFVDYDSMGDNYDTRGALANAVLGGQARWQWNKHESGGLFAGAGYSLMGSRGNGLALSTGLDAPLFAAVGAHLEVAFRWYSADATGGGYVMLLRGGLGVFF